jgi:hypothetical protein
MKKLTEMIKAENTFAVMRYETARKRWIRSRIEY